MKRYRGTPISMDFINADVVNVLRLLSEVADLNLQWSPYVSGHVSMRVKNVPWDQIIDQLLLNNDLSKRFIGSTLWITTKAHMAQIEAQEKSKLLRTQARDQEGRSENLKDGLNRLLKAKAYVNEKRIAELRKAKGGQFDFTKLIRLCQDLNLCFAMGAVLPVPMILRTILDHVPPVFGKKTFADVANSYSGGRSFKKSMQNLENSLRNISDACLHTQIRSKEVLPNETQVDFRNDLDVLLQDIARIAKKT